MKAERRHELQQNALAEWLISVGKLLKPYQNIIFTAAVVAVLSAATYAWWSRSSTEQTTKAWDALNLALATGDLEKLSRVMEDYPGTKVAYLAAVVAADYRLMRGCNLLFVDKALAQQELNKAIELYSDLERGYVPELVERAKFGLARAKEAKRELEEAAEYYEDLANPAKMTTFATAARERLAELNREEIKRMYDDFRQFDPKPVAPASPSSAGTSSRSGLGDATGEESSVIPNFGQMKLDGEEKKAEEKRAEEQTPESVKEQSAIPKSESKKTEAEDRPSPEAASPPTGDESK